MIYAYTGTNLFANVLPTPAQCLGPLPDAITCEVERDAEGLFDLTLTYPLEGVNARYLTPGTWLYAPAGGTLDMQFFCITQPEESIGGTVTVRADHVSYNARDILAAPFTAQTSEISEDVSFYPWSTALNTAVNTIDSGQRGSFAVLGYTDDMKLNAARYTEPVSLRQAVTDAAADRDVLILSSGFNLKLWQATDFAAPMFTIRYGRDMLAYSNAVEMDDFYTYIYPYAFDKENNYKTCGGKIFQLLNVPAEYAGVKKIRAVNMTGLHGLENGEVIDQGNFQTAVNLWMEDHPFTPFPQTISVESIPGEGDTYELGLPGDLWFTPSGSHTRATIVSLRYDAVKDLVTEIGVGRVQKDISDTIAGLMKRKGA